MIDPPLTAGNARVKEARKLSRRSVRAERRLFLADGPNAVAEALGVPGCVVEVFATVAATERHAQLAVAAPAWTLVEDRALDCARATPSRRPDSSRSATSSTLALPATPRLLAICAEIRDPGNAGTVIRCADAAGADGVVLAGDSVDPYNPKTVRASVGSLFHLPVTQEPDPYAALRAAQDAGLQVLAADGGRRRRPARGRRSSWRPDCLAVRQRGPRARADELVAAADHRVRIPIHGRAESLNLSTAAALCLYESARVQRG